MTWIHLRTQRNTDIVRLVVFMGYNIEQDRQRIYCTALDAVKTPTP